MPEGPNSGCHMCHIHDHAPASTLIRTNPLRASQSRSRNPSKSNTSHVHRSRPSLDHVHHSQSRGEPQGFHNGGGFREADNRSARVASALARLSERSHSLPGSRSSTLSREREVSVRPDGSPNAIHRNRSESVNSSRSRQEYNNVLAALLETRGVQGSLPSNHSSKHREPDLLTALPHSHLSSRASTLTRGRDVVGHGSNMTLAQDTDQDYYLHVHGQKYKDEARKQRFNLQTVLLIGCYTLLFMVAIIIGVVLCQQNGWLGFGHNDDDSVSDDLTKAPDPRDGSNSIRDLDRPARGRGANGRGNRPGPTIDYDYTDDGQPPRINSAGFFPTGTGVPLPSIPRGGRDPLRTVNFEADDLNSGSNAGGTRSRVGPNNGNRRRVNGNEGAGQRNFPVSGNSGSDSSVLENQDSSGSGKSINARDRSRNDNRPNGGANNRGLDNGRGQTSNRNPFNNFGSSNGPGRPGVNSRNGNRDVGGSNNPGRTLTVSNSNVPNNRGGNFNNGFSNAGSVNDVLIPGGNSNAGGVGNNPVGASSNSRGSGNNLNTGNGNSPSGSRGNFNAGVRGNPTGSGNNFNAGAGGNPAGSGNNFNAGVGGSPTGSRNNFNTGIGGNPSGSGNSFNAGAGGNPSGSGNSFNTGVGSNPTGPGNNFNAGVGGNPSGSGNNFNAGVGGNPSGSGNSFNAGAGGNPSGSGNNFNAGVRGNPAGSGNSFNAGVGGNPSGSGNNFNAGVGNNPTGSGNNFNTGVGSNPTGSRNNFNAGVGGNPTRTGNGFNTGAGGSPTGSGNNLNAGLGSNPTVSGNNFNAGIGSNPISPGNNFNGGIGANPTGSRGSFSSGIAGNDNMGNRGSFAGAGSGLNLNSASGGLSDTGSNSGNTGTFSTGAADNVNLPSENINVGSSGRANSPTGLLGGGTGSGIGLAGGNVNGGLRNRGISQGNSHGNMAGSQGNSGLDGIHNSGIVPQGPDITGLFGTGTRNSGNIPQSSNAGSGNAGIRTNSNLNGGRGSPAVILQGPQNANGRGQIRNLGNGNQGILQTNKNSNILLSGQNGQQTAIPNNRGSIDIERVIAEVGSALPTQIHRDSIDLTRPGHNWNQAKGIQNAKGVSAVATREGQQLTLGSPVLNNAAVNPQLMNRGIGTSHILSSNRPTNRAGMAVGSHEITSSLPGTTERSFIAVSTESNNVTPLHVGKGFTVQRGEIVSISTVKTSDPEISILQPDHDIVFHITPNAPDAGISHVGRPGSNPNETPMGSGPRTPSRPPGGRSLTGRRRERVRLRPHKSRSNSDVVRRWEHMDHQGTLSRGLVRSDGSFAFTNCRPPEVCGHEQVRAGG